jgi:ketosteroid isomerase-like protein
MNSGEVSNLVRKYYAAYESKDRKVVEALLSDDFRFTSPYDDHIDRATYFKKCWPNSANIRAFHIETLFENDSEAMVHYELEPTSGDPFRNTEHFRFEGSKIKAIEVFFGSVPKNGSSAPAHAISADEVNQKYLCLVYQEDEKLDALSPRELDSLVAECVVWVDELDRSGRHIYSAGLQSVRSATTLRKRNGQLSMTDGPFAETKEHLGGFTLLRARDLNEAIQLASRLPAARLGSVEVRPVLESTADLPDAIDRKIAAALRRSHRDALQPPRDVSTAQATAHN